MRRLLAALTWLYINRFPVIALVVVFLLGPFSRGSSLLGNVIELNDHGYIDQWMIASVAFLACFVCIAAINIVAYYGRERFGLKLRPQTSIGRLILFFIAIVPAILLVYSAGAESGWPWYSILALEIAGLCIAGAVGLTAKSIQFWLSSTPPHPPYVIFPVDLLPFVDRVLRALLNHPGPPAATALRWAMDWVFAKVAVLVARAKVRAGRSPSPGILAPPPVHLRNGHVFGAALFGYLLFLHLMLRDVPAIVYMLLLISLVTWTLSGMAFFFDRYRIPVLPLIALLVFVAGNSPDSDHFYRVSSTPSALRIARPSEVLARAGDEPILIATAGGGIQAGAHTAEALTKMEKQIPAFRRSLALISAVSGGSVGAMYYLANWPEAGSMSGQFEPVKAASTSSLDQVGWAWLNPDLWRAIIPWARDRSVDRGRVLEETFEQRAGLKDVKLSRWADLTSNGKLPSVILNSTVVERGEPMLFTTTQLAGARKGARNSLQEGRDTGVATAARLSATFPFVSPAARPDTPDHAAEHVVDGGYYDNYGVFSLLDWLEDGLLELQAQGKPLPKTVRIFIIESLLEDSKEEEKARGWFFQSFAPVVSLYNVREGGQRTNAERRLGNFRRYWNTIANREMVVVEDKKWNYNPSAESCRNQPLSWKLNRQQRGCIQ